MSNEETGQQREITKRRVEMRSVIALEDGSVATHLATDYVRPDHLDAYVTDARKNWQAVTVSEEPDAGPLGYDGPTTVPAHLPLPDAGRHYPAEGEAAAQLEAEAQKAAEQPSDENQEG